MKKTIKMVMISVILSMISFVSKDHSIYAYSEEINLDSLIENRNNQEELENKISNIEQNLESKSRYADNENQEPEMEVVSISFVEYKPESKNYLINEVAYMEKEKLNLEKQLEKCMIESIRIEKSIEESKRKYLEENNLSFISGTWPVPLHTEISSPFGDRIHPITGELSFHKGIDIPAPQNAEVVSSDDGIVIFSGVQNGYGNVVKIKHFDGKNTVYAHNNLNIVNEGDIVRQGQAIAKVGTTGNSTGNHLHFETIVNEENLNPINIVK
jgi:murein DD-endopeptidase MepM/ murein hydrolase activator NlpD